MPNVRYSPSSAFSASDPRERNQKESINRSPRHPGRKLSAPNLCYGLIIIIIIIIISAVIIAALIRYILFFLLATLFLICDVTPPTEIPLNAQVVPYPDSMGREESIPPLYYAAQNIIIGTSRAYLLLVGS